MQQRGRAVIPSLTTEARRDERHVARKLARMDTGNGREKESITKRSMEMALEGTEEEECETVYKRVKPPH